MPQNDKITEVHNIAEALVKLAVPNDSIKVDPANVRRHPDHNMEAIKRSLDYYGQRIPVVVNKATGYIEAGNARWEAAKALGWDMIAAVFIEDDPSTALGYAIMDNQSAILAEWDYPALKDALEGLDTGDFDMDLTGFDNKALEILMTQFDLVEQDQLGSSKEKEQVQCPECGHKFVP